MLLQFVLKNYKSFRDEVFLDFTATKKSEFNNSLLSLGSKKILPVAAVFGANASGKSNLYQAFFDMSNYVVNSFKFGGDDDYFLKFLPKPFLLDSTSGKEPTSFEVFFTIPGDDKSKTYNYGFSIDSFGIVEEWLNKKSLSSNEYKNVFYRDRNKLEFGKVKTTSKDNILAALEKQVLVISLGAKLKIDFCKTVTDWFKSNEFADFGDPVNSYFMSRRLPQGFVDEEDVRNKVVHYFSSFDESIKGFEVVKVQTEEDSEDERYLINSLHKKIGSDEKVKLPLSDESAGTLKMFALYPDLKRVLENGSVFFIDELNARLHPLLVRNFIQIFTNPEINKNHAQLVFTTHDSWQLSNKVLRRDEIWFTEKDKDGISSLYSLAEFKDSSGAGIRKDENYEKNYLLGRYGAIPDMGFIIDKEDN